MVGGEFKEPSKFSNSWLMILACQFDTAKAEISQPPAVAERV